MHGALGQDLTAAYRLGPLLGQGAFGAVHRARDVAGGRDVALKLLTAERQGAAAAVERFLREAAVVAALEHPGIVRVHAAGLHGGRLAIVYELVEAIGTQHDGVHVRVVGDDAR
ncbi:MAG: protein kinase [Planctomycetes bacterium]|nr:protein kinase [Planctomycetota bacterium]